MRVLLEGLVFDHPPTGIAKVTLGLYDACRRLDPSLELVVAHRRDLACDLPPWMRHESRWPAAPQRVWRPLAMPGAVRAHAPDLVHFPWNGRVPRLPAGPRIAMTLHDVLPLDIPGFLKTARDERAYRAAVQRDLDRCDLVITDSQYAKRRIREEFTLRQEPLVISPGPTLDPSLPDRFPQGAPEGRYFLYVGGYDPRKGLEPLLRVVTDLWTQGRLQSPLVLTGTRTYYSDDFRALMAKAVASGAAIELGYVTDAELATLYRHALALTYPSQYEGFGLPPLEAMTLGCPVIATKGTAIPEVCGEAALYIDPESDQALSQALRAMQTDASMRESMSESGKHQAAKFTWEARAKTWLAHL